MTVPNITQFDAKAMFAPGRFYDAHEIAALDPALIYILNNVPSLRAILRSLRHQMEPAECRAFDQWYEAFRHQLREGKIRLSELDYAIALPERCRPDASEPADTIKPAPDIEPASVSFADAVAIAIQLERMKNLVPGAAFQA